MPLLGGKSNIGKNISTEMSHGKPRKQAIAIALDVARRSGADLPRRKRNPENMNMSEYAEYHKERERKRR